MEILKVHNKFDEIIEKTEIKLPCTSATQRSTPKNQWLDKIEYQKLSIIDLTYGGGLGGSHEKLYCKRINNLYDYLLKNEFIEVTTIAGKEFILNRKYIVKANNDYEMVSAYLDNYNNIYPIGINQYNYLIPNGHKVTLINSY